MAAFSCGPRGSRPWPPTTRPRRPSSRRGSATTAKTRARTSPSSEQRLRALAEPALHLLPHITRYTHHFLFCKTPLKYTSGGGPPSSLPLTPPGSPDPIRASWPPWGSQALTGQSGPARAILALPGRSGLRPAPPGPGQHQTGQAQPYQGQNSPTRPAWGWPDSQLPFPGGTTLRPAPLKKEKIIFTIWLQG